MLAVSVSDGYETSSTTTEYPDNQKGDGYESEWLSTRLYYSTMRYTAASSCSCANRTSIITNSIPDIKHLGINFISVLRIDMIFQHAIWLLSISANSITSLRSENLLAQFYACRLPPISVGASCNFYAKI